MQRLRETNTPGVVVVVVTIPLNQTLLCFFRLTQFSLNHYRILSNSLIKKKKLWQKLENFRSRELFTNIYNALKFLEFFFWAYKKKPYKTKTFVDINFFKHFSIIIIFMSWLIQTSTRNFTRRKA